MAGDIFAAYRGRGGRFDSMFSVGSAGRAGGRFRSGWPKLVKWVESDVNLRGLSSEYIRGSGAGSWVGKGGRAHRVRWDIKWDIHWADPRLGVAAARVVNRMMAEAVLFAKGNHQGWRNRSGGAEASIRTVRSATRSNPEGQWGSDGSVHYFLFLELRYATLRAASDAVYNPTRMARDLVAELRRTGWGSPISVPGFRRSGLAPNMKRG